MDIEKMLADLVGKRVLYKVLNCDDTGHVGARFFGILRGESDGTWTVENGEETATFATREVTIEGRIILNVW